MRISWAAPDNNGLAITSYHVLILESDGATWTESGECDGSDSTVVSNLYCDVATSTLRASGYALTLNDAVVAKVRAYNLIGWGDYSPQTSGFGAGTITTEPAAPPTPVSEGADTSDEQLHIEWAALTGDDAGQEDITSYTVMWDSGDGGSSWTLLTFQLAGSFTYTHTRSAGVTSGGSYQFKYRAGNQQGVGEYSDISTIIASTVPDTLGSATTLNSGSDVVVSWPATSSERGATVTAYRVKFLESDGVTYTESSACDGASATPKTNRECTVAMTVFTSSPYSLAIDAPIVAVVEALNAKGYSTPSAGDSTGAQAETEPTTGPTASRGGDTTTSSLEVTWTAVSTSPDNGGASVTEYLVYWDNGSGSSSASWSLAATTDASTTRAVSTTSISPGTTYQFAVKAKNVHGTGPLGPTLSVLAATVPDAPEGLTAGSVTSTSVTFTWSAPSDNGGSAVTDYSIDWDSGGSAFFSSLTTSTSGATTYTATGLSASTAYGFRVAASNAVGEGAPSGTFTISTSA
jgi:titin